ncbi:hypothetical protein E3O62_12290 [Cryobacterium sp. TMT2-15-1]|uniref:DUF1801 domain-containing protein n=1 Tax=Cryobacterium sp. TMT2-15-1 TaxID=1259246 RepID=UPI00106DCE40|nr:DUF1801 domain-containing protein [Cryobacterium sp. TMT2-15-1]TFC56647.1 hypothetical protein E3O62_12290 [Cryobacterium sp. TMT2-15-1]
MTSIDEIIAALGDWRGDMLAHIRGLILEAEPNVVEETKWQKATNPLGVPTWSLDGLICTGETYKDKVKLTFAKGASLDDADELFNASQTAGVRRAIDLHEGDKINATAFQELVRAAATLNKS